MDERRAIATTDHLRRRAAAATSASSTSAVRNAAGDELHGESTGTGAATGVGVIVGVSVTVAVAVAVGVAVAVAVCVDVAVGHGGWFMPPHGRHSSFWHDSPGAQSADDMQVSPSVHFIGHVPPHTSK